MRFDTFRRLDPQYYQAITGKLKTTTENCARPKNNESGDSPAKNAETAKLEE